MTDGQRVARVRLVIQLDGSFRSPLAYIEQSATETRDHFERGRRHVSRLVGGLELLLDCRADERVVAPKWAQCRRAGLIPAKAGLAVLRGGLRTACVQGFV